MPVCPTGVVNSWFQSKTPRGRMLLLLGLLNGELQPSTVLADRVHTCTLCGYCSVKCPSGLKPDEIFLDARRALYSMGARLPHFTEVSRRIAEQGNPYDMPADERFMWLDYGQEPAIYNGKVGLWMGCTLAYRRPETAANIYMLMRKLVGDVALIKDEGCCGVPYYLIGDVEGYRAQVLKAFGSVERARCDYVVTPCPSCARAFTEFAENVGVRASAEVLYLPTFLSRLINGGRVPKLRLPGTEVTYHDPCEAGRHMNVFDEPRRAIKAVEGVTLREMRGNKLNSNCCGGGGLYMAFDSSRSLRIAGRRLEDVPERVSALVTTCPSCEVNLSIAVANTGVELEVLDLAELWWRALQGNR